MTKNSGGPRYRIGLLILGFALLLLSRVLGGGEVAAQDAQFIIWVYDQSLADSQFGYYDGTTIQATQPIFYDADIEGLACVNNVIYASGGLDGAAPSTLNQVTLDVVNQSATLTKIADIQTATGEPFFEVVSLSMRADGTLWGYADQAPLRGILQIDPATGVGELIEPFAGKVEAIAWLDDTLWLAGNNHFYRWTPGGAITHAFDIHDSAVLQIESLEVIDGLLYTGVDRDDRGVIAIDPNTGAIVPGVGFPSPNDTEGITFCPLPIEPTPTPTATHTPTLTQTPVPPTATPTPTSTPTSTSTATPTATPTRVLPLPPEPPTALDPTEEPNTASGRLYLPLVVN
jgi:hypothetical protein